MFSPRTGQQYHLVFGRYEATVTEQGAALRSLTLDGKDIIVPFDEDDIPNCCRGQLLIPFPNRIEDGEYEFEGTQYVLPIDEHERHNAIHGYGYRAYWTRLARTDNSVSLQWRAPALEGYPFDVAVTADYRLDEHGLSLTLSALNNGSTDAPWAAAMHPWLANGRHSTGDAIEQDNAECHLRVQADTHVIADDRLLPRGTEPVDGTIYDLRDNPTLEGRPFDDAWTDLHHDEEGNASAVLTRPDGMTITVSGGPTITSFQVCTGTGFPEAIRPQGVAVEPQTAYANAFRSGKDLIVIKPGDTSVTSIRISAEQR